MIVDNGTVLAREANAERHHHKGYLRDGGESEDALDVALRAGNGGSIERGEHADPYHHAERAGSIFYPHGEQTCYLENTGYDHRGGVTVRDRDTMEQERLPIDKLADYIQSRIQL